MAETVPDTMSPTRSLYSEKVLLRSASWIFCMIIWRDVWAAIRPRRAAGISTSIVWPSFTGLPWLKRTARASGMKPGPVSSSEHTSVSYTWSERSFRSMTTRRSFVTSRFFRAAC